MKGSLKLKKESQQSGKKELEIEIATKSRGDTKHTRRDANVAEELKSTNEELQSTNEELQSTNEELTTSRRKCRV